MSEPLQPIELGYQTSDQADAVDLSHLKVLAICHYVAGGLVILFSSIGLIYVAIGLMFTSGAMKGGPNPPPPQVGWIFVGMGSLFTCLGCLAGIANIISARFMQKRRRRLFSLVIAGIDCAWFPIGTVLGVFTFLVLLRTSVKLLYERGRTSVS